MTTTHFTGLHTVAVPVDDQDAALAFYRDTLGFEVRMDGDLQEGFRWIEVAPPGAAVSVALVAAGPDQTAGVDTGIRLATSDAAGAERRVVGRGVRVEELLRWDGVPPMFSMRDLDGNVLYVTEISAG